MREYDWLTIEPDGRGGYTVYGHGTHEETSVLAGRAMRQHLRNFRTLDEAKSEYPTARVLEWSTKGDYSSDPGPIPPSWFDPADAGERWNDD